MRVTVADFFTYLRMLCAVILLFLTPLGLPFLLIYALSGLSDALDGFFARKLNQVSPWGARLDSAADLLLYITVLVRLIPALRENLPRWFWYIVALILLLRLSAYLLSAVKFHRFASEHTLLNKASSILIFPVPFLLRLGFFPWYAALCCLVAGVAAAQELYIHWRRPLPEEEEARNGN